MLDSESAERRRDGPGAALAVREEMLTAHVLFMDIVGYSKLTDLQQAAVFRQLKEVVSGCPAMSAAGSTQDVVRAASGDGMALAFFGDPSTPLRCAEQVAERLTEEKSFDLRIGINSGPVVRQTDINEVAAVSGDGINTAQRVMDFADGGQILLSDAFVHELEQAGDPPRTNWQDLGVAHAKHGRRVHLFNYRAARFGRPNVPLKVATDDEWQRPRGLRLGLTSRNWFLGTFQLLGWLLTNPDKWRAHLKQLDPRLSSHFSIVELSLRQFRRNPEIRILLAQIYLFYPIVASLLMWLVLGPSGEAFKVNAPFEIGTFVTTLFLLTLLLGVGPGALMSGLYMVFITLSAPLKGFYGAGSAAVMILATAQWVLIIYASVRLYEVRRRFGWLRELSGAFLGLVVSVFVLAVFGTLDGYLRSLGASSRLANMIAVTLASFVAFNGGFYLLWGRWSRGFTAGQVLGCALSLVRASIGTIDVKQRLQLQSDASWAAPQAFASGVDGAMIMAMIFGFVFATGYRLAGARSGVLGILLVAWVGLVLNLFTLGELKPWAWLPLGGGVLGFIMARRYEATSA